MKRHLLPALFMAVLSSATVTPASAESVVGSSSAQAVADDAVAAQVLATQPWLSRPAEPPPPLTGDTADGFQIEAWNELEPEVVEAAADDLAAQEGIPQAQVMEEIERANAYFPIASVAQELAGDAGAGGWIDTETGTINLALVGDAETFEQRLSGTAARQADLAEFSQDINVVPVEYAWQDLHSAFEAALQRHSEWEALTGGPVQISIDTPLNRVAVAAVNDSEELRAAVAEVLGDVGITRQLDADDVGVLQCTRANCLDDPSMRGGLAQNTNCTTGFVGYRYVTGTANPPTWYVLSAGHCLAPYAVLRHAGKRWGVTSRSVRGPRTDSARADGEPNTFGTQAWIYAWDSAQQYHIKNVISSSWCKQYCTGTRVYRAGRNIGSSSGEITAALTQVGADVSQGFTYRAAGCGGDSGGPIHSYPQQWAMGIHSLGIGEVVFQRNGEDCRPGGGASHINDVEDDMTVFV